MDYLDPSDDSSPPSRIIPLHWEEVEPDPGEPPLHLGLAAAGASQGLGHAAGGQVSSVSIMTGVSPSSSFSARFITGFCGGMFVLAAPAYSSEVAEARYRGALGSLMQVMVCTLYSAVQYCTLQYSTAPLCR